MVFAIKYEKIDLGDDKYVFKPVSVVKGEYDKETGIFVTDYGDYCNSINGESQYEDNYFGNVATLEELKKAYGNNVELNELLAEYFESFIDFYYVAYFDYTLNRLVTLSIPRSGLESAYSGEKGYEEQITNTAENTDEYTDEDKAIVGLGLEDLEELRKINNIDDLHASLDQIISFLHMSRDAVKMENVTQKSASTLNKQKQPKKLALKKEASKKNILLELRKEVLDSIIGQDEAVNDITRALAINYTSKNPRNKSHILVTGPSGTGKTEIINIIANRLNMPMFKADATAYTKSGYQGKEVNSMLAGLLSAANDDLEAAQKGILIIDEIDKKGGDIDSKEGDFDRAVFHSLLKIMDRDVVEVDMPHGQKVLFDTSNITVILMGSFDTLYEKKQMYKSKPIGFNKSQQTEVPVKTRIDEDDLIKWLGSEFEGRIGMITSTDELTVDDVVKILYKSKISQLKTIKEDLENRGIKLTYTSGYVREIAKQGLNKKTGARKLNKVVKNNLKYAYDEILTKEGVKTLKLTKKTALNPKDYCIEYM